MEIALPINWQLLGHPLNWLLIVLIVILVAYSAFTIQAHAKQLLPQIS